MPGGKEASKSRLLSPTWIPAYCALLLAAMSFAKYSTPKSFYRSSYFDVINPGLLVNDIFLRDHISLKSSFFYKFIDFFQLPLYDDLVGLTFFLAASALSLWMTYRIVREFCGVTEPATAAVVTLLLGFSYNKILMTVHGGATTLHAVPQNALAHALGIAALYFIIGRRVWLAALSITLVLLVAPKGGFVLLPIAMVFFLMTRDVKPLDVLALAVPVVAVVTLSGKVAFPDQFEALILICERVIAREDYEVAFHLQPLSALALFVASLAATPFLAKRIENPDFRRLFWCVAIVTLGLLAFGLFYVTVGYKIYPNPKLIMVSPVRAAKFHIFLVSLVTVTLILKSEGLSWFEKVGAATAFLVLRGDLSGIGYAAIVLMGTFGVSKILKGRMTFALPVLIVVPLIVTAVFSLQLPRSYPVARMDLEMYRLTGHWTRISGIGLPALSDFKRLADMPEDFVLLGLYKDGERYRPVLNPVDLMARKSSFIGEPATFYHRPALWDEAVKREQIAADLTSALNEGRPVAETTLAQLRDRGARIMAPSETGPLFPPSTPREPIGAHLLFTP